VPEWWTEPSRENFELTRRLVEHEDGLINVRTNWALAFHALLFNAFVGGVALYEKVQFKSGWLLDPVSVGLVVAALLGIGSACAAFLGVRAAERQLKITSKWWADLSAKAGATDFPPMYLHYQSQGKIRASVYFLVIGLTWAGLLLLVVCAPSLLLLPSCK